MKNLFSVEGKTVLVTGGSRGIGEMIATGFVENGAKVYIASRKGEECERVAAELSKSGTCVPIQADLSTEAGVRALADTIAARESSLHVLVNNAGANWGEAVRRAYPDSAPGTRCWRLNVKGRLPPDPRPDAHCSRRQPTPRRAIPARVINIASIDGIQASRCPRHVRVLGEQGRGPST